MRKVTVLLAALSLVVGIAGSANAGVNDDVDYNTVASVEVEVTTGLPERYADGRVCSRKSVAVITRNLLGVFMYKFGNTARGCARNGRVVSMSWNVPYADTGALSLWRYDGSYIEERGGGEGTRYAYRQWRGHFHFCVTWICRDRYPYVYLGFRGDGTWGARAGH